jgi:hypothetical protein
MKSMCSTQQHYNTTPLNASDSMEERGIVMTVDFRARMNEHGSMCASTSNTRSVLA